MSFLVSSILNCLDKRSPPFLPIINKPTSASLYFSSTVLIVCFVIDELKPPHKPLFEVTTTNKTLETVLSVEYAPPASLSKVALKFCNNSVSLDEYGRIAVIASCAFFNFAADTIFMADVICIVDLIEVILLRISFKFAILLEF